MAQVQLEKMTYRFSVIAKYDSNTYILDIVQKALQKAEDDVAAGTNNAPQSLVYTGHWNVKRNDVYIDID